MRINRRQRGEGQMGCVVGLIFLALALFIAYKMVPVKVKAADLKQTITDEAKSAGTHNDEKIHDAIYAKAQELTLPVKPEDIKVSRQNSEITVDVEFDVPIDFPGWTYKWHQHYVAQNPIF